MSKIYNIDMQIKYSNKLEKKLGSNVLIKKNFAKVYKSVIILLDVLKMVENLSEISHCPPFRRHKLSGDYVGLYSLDLNRNYRMIIKDLKGEEDLKKIDSVEIYDIVDYH